MKKDLKHLLQDYISFIQYTEPKSKLTVEAYKTDLESFIKYLENIEVNNFNDVSYEVLLTYISELEGDYASATIDRKVSSIRNLFKYLIQYQIINNNVTSYLSNKRKPLKLPKALTEAQLNQLFSFERITLKDHLDYAILMVLFRTGLRVSECVNLAFSQIYTDEKWLRIIGKGNKERMVPIADDAITSLNYYIKVIRPQFERNSTKFVFINQKGMHITRQYIHTMIQYRRNQTGLKSEVSAHTLRHSLATSLLKKEVDLRVIQEILGHSDISTTQIYTHVDNEAVRNEYDKYLNVNFNKEEE